MGSWLSRPGVLAWIGLCLAMTAILALTSRAALTSWMHWLLCCALLWFLASLCVWLTFGAREIESAARR